MNIKILTGVILSAMVITNTYAADDDFLLMSLEELMQVEIYTASQENEKAAKTPASISIITAQQIKEWV